MARKNLRSLTRISAISTIFAISLTALIAPANAQSVVLVRPATQWGSVYAGPATTAKQDTTPKVAHLEKKAKFIVKYNNFPEWTKIQVQAAIDTLA